MAQPPLPLALDSGTTSINKDEGVFWGVWGGLVAVALAAFILQRAFSGHPPSRSRIASIHAIRKAQKLAKRELLLLQTASMDVSSVYLFPEPLSSPCLFVLDLWQLILHLLGTLSGILLLGMPTKSKNNDQDEGLDLDDCLLQLLYLIRATVSTNTPTLKNNNHRIYVLGRVLWFRFHVHAKSFTRGALEGLLETQRQHRHNDDFNATKNKEKAKDIQLEDLSCMKATILWAVLPQDRPIISHCLDELAWALRLSIDDSDFPCKNVSCWSADVLTLMLECILQTYDIGKLGEIQQQPPQDPDCPDAQSPADGSLDPDQHSNQAKRLFGYLNLLGVFMPCDDSLGIDKNNDIEENDLVRLQLHSGFQLRPGILKKPKTSHLNGGDEWTKTFATRLIENAGNDFYNTGISSHFYLNNLPSIFVSLGCYSQCSHLLQYNEAFATARLQYLGLKRSVDAYISEWDGLQHCMQGTLLLASEKKNPVDSPILDWLCRQTFSTAIQELALPSTGNEPTVNLKDSIKRRQSLAATCYRLGMFAMNPATITRCSSGDEKQRSYNNIHARELLHKGRHLQLLVLEALCRYGAKSIENLGITVHVRDTVRQKNEKQGVATESSMDRHSIRLEPKKYFELSQQLFDTITKLCRDHKGDNTFTETTLDELATSLCQALAKTASDLIPLPPRQSNAQPPGRVSPGPAGWADGMDFRIQQMLDVFRQVKDASQRYAKFQHAICTLPSCSAAQVEATTDFLLALSQLEGIIL